MFKRKCIFVKNYKLKNINYEKNCFIYFSKYNVIV